MHASALQSGFTDDLVGALDAPVANRVALRLKPRIRQHRSPFHQVRDTRLDCGNRRRGRLALGDREEAAQRPHHRRRVVLFQRLPLHG
jgi:hypothetical protein